MHRSRGENVHEMLGAIGPMGRQWRLGQIPRSQVFVCRNRRYFVNLLAADFHQIWPTSTWIRVPSKRIGRVFEIFFPFRSHFPTYTSKLRVSNRYLTLTSVQPRDAPQRCCSRLHDIVQDSKSFLSPVSFLYDVLWNSLPSSVRNAPSLTTFRRELNSENYFFGRRLTMMRPIRRSWLYCTV